MTDSGTDLLRDVLSIMASGESLDAVLHGVAQVVVDHLDAAFARVWLIERSSQDLVLVASAGQYTHLDGPHGRIPMGRFKIGRIAATRTAHLTLDVADDPAIGDPDWAKREGMQSFAGYPLIVANNLIGVLGLFSRHRMTRAEFDLIATVADAVAAGAERLQSDQRARGALRALHEIGRTLVAELDLERAVQIVTDAATENIGAAFGAFFYNVVNDNGESFTLYTLSGVPRSAFEGFPLPRNTAVFAPTFNGERTVRFDDVTARAEFGQNTPYRGMPEGHLPVRSYLAVPVVGRDGVVIGGLFFAHPEPGQFSQADEELVEGIAGYAAVAITNAQEYQQEQQIALTLQEAVLPTIHEHPDVEVAVRYLPAAQRAEVGGDWYDTVTLPDGRLAITVGDVAGHSVKAAARMGAVRHALGVHAVREADPGPTLFELDRYLTITGQHGFVTVVQALYDPERRLLRVARAGHLPPLVVPEVGEAWFLRGSSSPPLGLGLVTSVPAEQEVGLDPGTSVVFFTDGLVERRHVDIDERLEALRVLMSGRGALSPDEMCDLMISGLLQPDGAADDVALLVLKPTVERVVSSTTAGPVNGSRRCS